MVAADQYNISVGNAFQALGSLPRDVEDSWSAIYHSILQTAHDTLPVVIRARRRWLTPETNSVCTQEET